MAMQGKVGTMASALTADEQSSVVGYHNDYKRTVAFGEQEAANGKLPAAADMLEYSYDTDVESAAQDWADSCNFSHNGYAGGQNLAVFGGSGMNNTALLQQSVQMWFNEVEDFDVNDVSDFEVDSSATTGHFTQVIWAKSSTLGCGVQQCATIENLSSDFDNGYIVVCNYQSAGNYLGQPVYTEGDACSKCPDGYICDNGLCSQSS
ncbi:unnamed protein product [Bursaphelenchus okinawaensis]|uniref:SCP domain-containing protein n=1 Tax=Bursaphelenchus okinawaensis TaxID=465554 RepID=A0A811L377_9BILA|nr:unnamed protein product [Bursaphelenchus okinawaensis]CAG9118198.1 unnamed protein product [Bursaphelenchus okinawaensis]